VSHFDRMADVDEATTCTTHRPARCAAATPTTSRCDCSTPTTTRSRSSSATATSRRQRHVRAAEASAESRHRRRRLGIALFHRQPPVPQTRNRQDRRDPRPRPRPGTWWSSWQKSISCSSRSRVGSGMSSFIRMKPPRVRRPSERLTKLDRLHRVGGGRRGLAAAVAGWRHG